MLALVFSVLAVGCAEKTELIVAPPSAFITALPNSTGIYARRDKLHAITAEGNLTWSVKLPKGRGVAPAAAAPNSMFYVRTENSLMAYSHEGELIWTVKGIESPSITDPYILAPIAMADSSVAVVVSNNMVRSFKVDGTKKWTAVIPSGVISAPLVPCQNGQIIVETGTDLHAIAPDGKIVWGKELSKL